MPPLKAAKLEKYLKELLFMHSQAKMPIPADVIKPIILLFRYFKTVGFVAVAFRITVQGRHFYINHSFVLVRGRGGGGAVG